MRSKHFKTLQEAFGKIHDTGKYLFQGGKERMGWINRTNCPQTETRNT